MLAAIALTAALWWTRPSGAGHAASDRLTGSTPERAAESFIEAYQSGAFERAARFATGELAQTLAVRPKSLTRHSAAEPETFNVLESERLPEGRLRLSGVLVREDEPEAEGRAVSLTLQKHDDRYLVEEFSW